MMKAHLHDFWYKGCLSWARGGLRCELFLFFFCGRDLLFCEDQRVQQIYTQKKVPSQQQINSPWPFVGFSYSTASV